MSDTFTSKLGTTRAGERSRIWIEGTRLVAAGFTCGKRFERDWYEGGLELRLVSEAHWADLPVSERGTVSGKGTKPIIDITGTIVRDTFGSGAHVSVTYARGTITIRKA